MRAVCRFKIDPLFLVLFPFYKEGRWFDFAHHKFTGAPRNCGLWISDCAFFASRRFVTGRTAGGFGASFCFDALKSDCKRRDKPDNGVVSRPEPQLRRYERAERNDVEASENQTIYQQMSET
jgi:hypothetical protein